MRRPNGKDEGRGGKDLQVLQNEYKHMQVNRNAFANESELVRMNDFNRHYIVSLSPQPSTYQLIRTHASSFLHFVDPTQTANDSEQAESRK